MTKHIISYSRLTVYRAILELTLATLIVLNVRTYTIFNVLNKGVMGRRAFIYNKCEENLVCTNKYIYLLATFYSKLVLFVVVF